MDAFRFGEGFELDPGAYVLRRSGEALKLERIPMEILLLLMEHRGKLVTREQIVERVWGKGTYLDVDNSINGAIRKIRQVLQDDPEHPRFIRTVARRGYRFTAPVAPIQDPAAVSQPALAPSTSRARRWMWIASAAAVLILLTAGGVVLSRARAVPSRVMVAVLPFDNLTGDARQEYFSDGLTEEMITQIGERDPEHLGVIARTSVMHYKRDRAPMDQIARELGVEYLLEGSVRRDANQVRVTAQLIRAADQTQLWARQYDRKPADLLTLQDEIAQAIANEIQASLGRPRTATRGEATPSANGFEAYDLYLRGQFYLNRRTVPDFEKAIGYFQQATAADPNYARAYAALADAYSLLAGYSSMPPQTIIAHARAAAVRALALDSTLAEAHTAYALIVQNDDWDWQTAEREYRRAIALNPNYATAHHWYAEHLMWLGHFDEALQESERARRLDPLSLIIAADNGAIHYYARQYDKAIEKWRAILQIQPEFPRAHIIFLAYMERGMYADALADVEGMRPWLPPAVYWSDIAMVKGRAGQVAEAKAALREMLQAAQRHPVQSGVVAAAYLGAGDTDGALTELERAYAQHSNDMTSLRVAPIWDPLRSNPRFQRLLARVGLSN